MCLLACRRPAQPLGGEHARFDVDRERDLLLRGEQCDLPESAQVARDGVDVGGEGLPRRAAVEPGGGGSCVAVLPGGRPVVVDVEGDDGE